MPIDDRTTGRAYQMPNIGNWLADDVVRLREALAAIDADIMARYTKTEVDNLVNGLVNGAPGALNTLQELAAALGGDANFSATVLAQLALKANAAEVYSRAESDARYVQGQTQAEMVFVATANQTAFSLSTAVINKPSALVSVDGVIQPTSEYSLNQAGTVLTLSEGVALGTVVRVLALGVASSNAPGDDTVTTPKLRDAAVTTPKLSSGSVTDEKLAAGAVTPTKLSQPLTLMTAQASTSGTEIEFTSIPSWAKKITIILEGVSANGTGHLLVQIGAANIVTSGYASTSSKVSTDVSTINSTNGFVSFSDGAETLWNGHIVLTTPGSNKWICSSVLRGSATAMYFGAGSIALNAVLQRISLRTTSSDTFDNGTINVLYE